MNKQISIPTLRRLPNYYPIVCQAFEEGEKYISSATIAKILDIDDTQVRKDIAATGYVGKPKVGFYTQDFKKHLEDFLGFNNTKDAFLVGAGNLGVALAKYEGFNVYGLEIVALFDNDPHKIGLKIRNKEVFSISKFPEMVSNKNIQMVILTIPAESAQSTTDFLVSTGIKAIWNFAPITLRVPKNVLVWNQDLAASFVTLSLHLTVKQKQNQIIEGAAGHDY